MKYTNGKKADTSAFPFKIDTPSATSDSPAKFTTVMGAGLGQQLGSKYGTAGRIGGAIAGGAVGTALTGFGLAAAPMMLGMKRQLDGTAAAEKQYADVLESEGLERGFWGKLGFGGGKSKQRAQRIKELQEQDRMGIDRERIESRGGVTAGAGV